MFTTSRTSALAEMSSATSISPMEVISALVSRNENQLNDFTNHQAFVQRVLSVSASTTSIVFVLAAFYCFLFIDPKRFVFRHHLIFFLLLFDLLKAVVLLLYPARVLTHDLAYYNDNFCQVVGFFSAFAIEGADIAILSFAIHTSLLIFKPNLTFKVTNGTSTRTEGGLYSYRWYIYGISFLLPGLLAGLAFLNPNRRGYDSFVCWCYLPQHPVWSRFVLSWVPRYCILIIIIGIYCAIYFHVIKEFKLLGGVFTTMHKRSKIVPSHSYQEEKPSFFSALKFLFDRIREFFIPELVLPDGDEEKLPKKEAEEESNHNQERPQLYDQEFHRQNLDNFRKRQKVIKKQMKSIFVYPIAYILLWLFPFILYITQVNYESTHKPIYWLNCMGAFMQPLFGFVDSLVFFYRERPWQHTILKTFEREYGSILSESLVNGSSSTSASQAESHSVASSGNQNATSPEKGAEETQFANYNANRSSIRRQSQVSSKQLRNQSLYSQKESLVIPSLVNIDEYPLWRRILSSLKLPFFALPTDENVLKLQLKELNKKLSQQQAGPRSSGSQIHDSLYPGGTGIYHYSNQSGQAGQGATSLGSGPKGPSDFSNILGGGSLDEGAFRQLDNFSFNKSGTTVGNAGGALVNVSNASFRSRAMSHISHASHGKSSRASIGSKRSSHGGASSRNRQLSFVDPHLKSDVPHESAEQHIASNSNTGVSNSGPQASHLAPPLAKTGYSFVTQKVHEKNTTPISGVHTPYASPRTSATLFGDGSGDSLKKSSNYSTNTIGERTSDSDDDLDFLQFLRQCRP